MSIKVLIYFFFYFRILPKTVGHLFVGGLSEPFAVMKVNSTLKELNNKIIECRFENNSWVFMRERTDKSFPNSFSTASGKNNLGYVSQKDVL